MGGSRKTPMPINIHEHWPPRFVTNPEKKTYEHADTPNITMYHHPKRCVILLGFAFNTPDCEGLLLGMCYFTLCKSCILDGGVWRFIPVAKWLVNPPCKSLLGHWEGEQTYIGEVRTMVITVYANWALGWSSKKRERGSRLQPQILGALVDSIQDSGRGGGDLCI